VSCLDFRRPVGWGDRPVKILAVQLGGEAVQLRFWPSSWVGSHPS